MKWFPQDDATAHTASIPDLTLQDFFIRLPKGEDWYQQTTYFIGLEKQYSNEDCTNYTSHKGKKVVQNTMKKSRYALDRYHFWYFMYKIEWIKV